MTADRNANTDERQRRAWQREQSEAGGSDTGTAAPEAPKLRDDDDRLDDVEAAVEAMLLGSTHMRYDDTGELEITYDIVTIPFGGEATITWIGPRYNAGAFRFDDLATIQLDVGVTAYCEDVAPWYQVLIWLEVYRDGIWVRVDGTYANITVGSEGVETPTIRSITASTTLLETDNILLVDATGGNIVVTLPAVADSDQWAATIKRVDSSANTVTIDGSGAETIDDEITQVLALYESAQIVCDGSEWHIL